MKTLKISIDCGETTCASTPGVFCKFFGTRKFGSVSLCNLFTNPNPGYKESESSMPLEDKNGWVQRCKQCLEAEEVSC